MSVRDLLRTVTVAGAVSCLVPCVSAQILAQPNILWLTCEDNSTEWVGCYGNPHADTPNIDRLAAQGFRYTQAYANAPVCAPSRST